MAQLAGNLPLVDHQQVPSSVALVKDQTKIKAKERTREKYFYEQDPKLALNRRDERSNKQIYPIHDVTYISLNFYHQIEF